MNKPDAPSCARNREPILAVLKDYCADRRDVLEIGSGTGQHAVYFAAALPHLNWQTSERAENLAGIQAWLDEAALANTPPPIELDVMGDWPRRTYDTVFAANILHIMSWPQVERLFQRLPEVIKDGARLLIYGAFNYDGRYTSPSNADFDAWLKTQDPARGLRDFAAVNALAETAGLHLLEDRAMPSNNRCLIWERP